MRVRWTERATARLRRLSEHVAERNPSAVEPTVRRILLASQRLETLPRLGRAVPEFQHPELREILERPYRIIYLLGPEGIDVITVMHYRELLPDDLLNP